MKKIIATVSILTLLVLGGSCSKDVERAYWPTDEWQRATPESVGFSSEKLLEAITSHDFDAMGLHSLLMIKNGYVILEVYRYPYGPETLHNVNSVTKSFISTLYGIALDHKKVKNVSSRVLDYFPEYKANETDGRKLAMTVEDVLTMRTGQNWNEETTSNMDNSFEQMLVSDNWLDFILGTPMMMEPGIAFDYNTGASHIISAIIQKTTGGTEAFAREQLFGPLGIRNYAWKNDPQGIPAGGYGLSLRARDLAKLGFLYLNGGRWDGELIVSKKWTEQATAIQTDAHGSFNPTWNYGYQWWLEPAGQSYSAQGYGGQYLVVYPDHDAILVTNSNLDYRKISAFSSLIGQALPNARVSKDPLPENEPAAQALRDACAALQLPPEEKMVTLPSRIDESGLTVEFGINDSGIRSVRFARSPEGMLQLELVYCGEGLPEVTVPLEAGCDNRYRMNTVFFPETHYQFDDKPSLVACRVIESDSRHVAVEILPIGVVAGPFIANTSFDGSEVTLTYTNRATRQGKTVTGAIRE